MTKTGARADIKPAHIWRPSMAKRAFQLTFANGFCFNTRFESKSQKCMITRPYAHAGLAPGEVQVGASCDAKNAEMLTYATFREIDLETQKSLHA